MTRPWHPKERPVFTRRAFLQRAAAAGIALPTASAILAACGSGAQSSVATSGAVTDTGQFGSGGVSGAPYPLARPDAPVTWNVDQSKVIPSDQQPEQNAEVQMLRWPYYLAPSVIKSFEDKYHCKVIQTEFEDMDKGIKMMTAAESPLPISG